MTPKPIDIRKSRPLGVAGKEVFEIQPVILEVQSRARRPRRHGGEDTAQKISSVPFVPASSGVVGITEHSAAVSVVCL